MAEHPVRRLQALDLEAIGLRAERAALPEREALREREREVAELAQRRPAISEELARLQQQERALETEVEDVAARAKSLEDELYSGRVTAPKELEALQHELESCRARQAGLEESELELMEAAESVDAELAAMAEREDEIGRENADLAERLAAGEARIDARLDGLAASRAEVCPEVEPKLLAAYEKRRDGERLAGRVITELTGSKCGRCKVTLPVTEVTRLHAEGADAFAVCASCHRLILP